MIDADSRTGGVDMNVGEGDPIPNPVSHANRLRTPWRTLSLAFGLLTSASALAAAPEDKSLARYAPASVGLFAEAREATDLLIPLVDPQLWSTLAELAGQPAQPEEAAEWRRIVEQTVGMSPVEAIRALFAQQVAFFGEAPGRSADFVVLCRPVSEPQSLLDRWNARRLADYPAPGAFQLYANIGVAVQDDVLAFGDLLPADGAFRSTLRLLEEPPHGSLADDPTYRSLLARAPDAPDGLLFARLTPRPVSQAGSLTPQSQPASSPTDSQPASALSMESQPSTGPSTRPAPPPPSGLSLHLPGPLRGSHNLLLALRREGRRLLFTAVGDGPGATRVDSESAAPLLETLPEATLAAWAGPLDYPLLARHLRDIASRPGPLAVIANPAQLTAIDALAGTLSSSTCVALGTVSPAERPAGAPPIPAFAWLVPTSNADEAQLELEALLSGWTSLIDLLGAARGLPPLPPIVDQVDEGVTVHVLDLSAVIRSFDNGVLHDLHLCWAEHDGVLIVTTHSDWMAAILRSRRAQSPVIGSLARLADREVKTDANLNCALLRAREIAQLGARWLGYVQRTAPDAMREDWWRTRQPGAHGPMIGVDVEQDGSHRRLRVVNVTRGMPSEGRLAPGDLIVGCNNLRFQSEAPIAEIREAVVKRPHARYVELLVERAGRTQRVRIPLPFVDPIQVLRRLVAIGGLAELVVYHDDSQPDAPRGFLMIELQREAAKP